MSGARLSHRIANAWARCSAFLSESWTLSAEAGFFYTDPLHLGPMFGVLYSNEGHVDCWRAEELLGPEASDDARRSAQGSSIA